jgi:hypothetical protein
MDEQLMRNYRRWREAEDAGRDDEADAALARVFQESVPARTVSAAFVQRTVDAVSTAAARDVRRARNARRLIVPAALVSLGAIGYLGAGLIGSALSGLVVGVLDLLVGLVVSVATTTPEGGETWTVMSSLGRAAAALLTNPAVTATILAIQGIALVALLALKRVLGSDGEYFR